MAQFHATPFTNGMHFTLQDTTGVQCARCFQCSISSHPSFPDKVIGVVCQVPDVEIVNLHVGFPMPRPILFKVSRQ